MAWFSFPFPCSPVHPCVFACWISLNGFPQPRAHHILLRLPFLSSHSLRSFDPIFHCFIVCCGFSVCVHYHAHSSVTSFLHPHHPLPPPLPLLHPPPLPSPCIGLLRVVTMRMTRTQRHALPFLSRLSWTFILRGPWSNEAPSSTLTLLMEVSFWCIGSPPLFSFSSFVPFLSLYLSFACCHPT